MENMAYCRFENTLAALQECETALNDGGLEELSEQEREKAKELLMLCESMAIDYL